MNSKNNIPVIVALVAVVVCLAVVLNTTVLKEDKNAEQEIKDIDEMVAGQEKDSSHTGEFEEIDDIDDLNETLGGIEDVYDDLDETDAELDRLITELEGIEIEDEF